MFHLELVLAPCTQIILEQSSLICVINFLRKKGLRIFELQKESAYLLQGQFSVEEYYTKFKALVDELTNYQTIPFCKCPCTYGSQRIVSDLNDRDQVMRFFMGLNDSYSAIRG